jgi:hypothetical protein
MTKGEKFWHAVDNFLLELFYGDTLDHMNLEPEEPTVSSDPDALLPWGPIQNNHHNIRALCDLEGLTLQQKNDLTATLHCESGWDIETIHKNVVDGIVASTDYGICQINDYYHIGEGKDFPSVDFVMQNPEACVRWMCKQWKAGNGRLWVCFSKSLYKQYSS